MIRLMRNEITLTASPVGTAGHSQATELVPDRDSATPEAQKARHQSAVPNLNNGQRAGQEHLRTPGGIRAETGDAGGQRITLAPPCRAHLADDEGRFDGNEGAAPMTMPIEPTATEVRSVERQQSQCVTALRVHTALTAPLEKRLLTWMARRVPAGISPDHLTGLALASQMLAGVAYVLSSKDARALWFVNCFLVLNWLGDSLDGTLARIRKQQRPRYGFYVDHMADTFGALALMAGLGCSGYVHWQIAAGMLVCFYSLSIESYLATYTIGRFHLSHGIFGPTELRILLATGNALLYAHAYVNIASRRFLLFDVGGAVGIAGMAMMVLAAAARHTALLYREERLR